MKARFVSYPLTEPPPGFMREVISIFHKYEDEIATERRSKGLISDDVLSIVRDDLSSIGFMVESGKKQDQKIKRPVFYGENGIPTVRFEVDAYHPSWKCGLEIEAGRAFGGNAVYRDLVQALIMVQVEYLILAVPNIYKFAGSPTRDFDRARNLGDALYGHSRVKLPYGLIIIGY